MKPPVPAPLPGIGPRLVPVATMALLALFSAVPLQIPHYEEVTPNLLLVAVYHWTIYDPLHLSSLAVFLIGLFFDLITTAPGAAVGFTPLLLLLARLLILSNRRLFVGRSFPYVWAGFGLLEGAAALFLWGGGVVLTGTLPEPRGFVFQAVLTVACFPLATVLFARLQRATAAQR